MFPSTSYEHLYTSMAYFISVFEMCANMKVMTVSREQHEPHAYVHM